MTWKCFPHSWPFVMGIHRSSMVSPLKRPVMPSLSVSSGVRMNKLWNKQSGGWLVATPWRSHDVTAMKSTYVLLVTPEKAGLRSENNFIHYIWEINCSRDHLIPSLIEIAWMYSFFTKMTMRKVAYILPKAFSIAFASIKTIVFWLISHYNLFPNACVK